MTALGHNLWKRLSLPSLQVISCCKWHIPLKCIWPNDLWYQKPNKPSLEICQRVASSVLQLTEIPNKADPEIQIFHTYLCCSRVGITKSSRSRFQPKYVYWRQTEWFVCKQKRYQQLPEKLCEKTYFSAQTTSSVWVVEYKQEWTERAKVILRQNNHIFFQKTSHIWRILAILGKMEEYFYSSVQWNWAGFSLLLRLFFLRVFVLGNLT